MSEEEHHHRQHSNRSYIIAWTATIFVVAVAIGVLFWLLPKEDDTVEILLNETFVIETEPVAQEETEETEEMQHKMSVPDPGIDEQLLTVNEWSRPGIACDEITGVVIHYLGNPNTTAQQNHDYFESLKDTDEWLENGTIDESGIVFMSANFVVGIDGEIIECVPPGEIAYASNSANSYTVSIEDCHLDQTGRFTEETYDSLVRLTAYVLDMYDLGRDDILRHYDITGKECPLYFVEHEDAWERFKDEVMNYLEECREAANE